MRDAAAAAAAASKVLRGRLMHSTPPAHPVCSQYTWIFAIAVIVGFFESYGIGANDLVRPGSGTPQGCRWRRLDSMRAVPGAHARMGPTCISPYAPQEQPASPQFACNCL